MTKRNCIYLMMIKCYNIKLQNQKYLEEIQQQNKQIIDLETK